MKEHENEIVITEKNYNDLCTAAMILGKPYIRVFVAQCTRQGFVPKVQSL